SFTFSNVQANHTIEASFASNFTATTTALKDPGKLTVGTKVTIAAAVSPNPGGGSIQFSEGGVPIRPPVPLGPTGAAGPPDAAVGRSKRRGDGPRVGVGGSASISWSSP